MAPVIGWSFRVFHGDMITHDKVLAQNLIAHYIEPIDNATPSEPTMQTTYFNGDKARYTGKTLMLHGGLFYEILILEGHLKGQTKVTQRAPK